MSTPVPDLTPPTKAAKAPKVPKDPSAPKAEKAPKVAKDPNAPKVERAARTDYGYSAESVIRVVKDKENKYRGKRKEWFDGLVAADGQTVASWAAGKGGEKDPPRGWLRFFVQDGTISLDKPAPAVSTDAAPAAPAA